MKKIFVSILVAIAMQVFYNMAISQEVIDVCATDTIRLRAGNYQYGTLQWERSFDMVNWQAIPNANDTVYEFVPERSLYYRLVNKQPDCPPEYSDISFVQLPPVANAGFDRIVPGNSVRLSANTSPGAIGEWSIYSGANGSISNTNNPYAVFEGTGEHYQLVWTLINACGMSSDTMEITFRENVYVENIAIVDTTDVLLSTPEELQEGIYIITFSDPPPTIEDGTFLIGITEGGFLRKVDSFSVEGDTYTINTSAANLEDITEFGAYDLAQAFMLDTDLNPDKNTGNYVKLDRMPKRQDLATNKKFRTGNYYYVVNTDPLYLYPGVSFNKSEEDGALLDFDFDEVIFENENVSLELNGYYRFFPNFVADLDYSWLNLKYFKMGLDNAREEKNIELNFDGSFSSGTSEPQKFTIFSINKDMIFVIGGVPIWIRTNFTIDGESTLEVSASIEFMKGFTKNCEYNAYIEYKNQNWKRVFSHDTQTDQYSSLDIAGSLNQTFDIGPRLTFTVFGVVGPYVDLRLDQDLNICYHNANWQTTMNIGGSLTLGAAAKMIGWNIFDISRTWSRGFFHYQYPNTIEIISGNNQLYEPGSAVANKVKVKVNSTHNLTFPGVRVRFEPQNGGSVENSIVTADANGYAETSWTPGGSELSRLQVKVLDCEENNITNSPTMFFAYSAASGINCSQSSLVANIVKSGSIIRPQGEMGVPPYTYSTDGVNFSSQAPEVTPEEGVSYLFFVKDANGCFANTTFTESSVPCENTTLAIEVESLGSTVTVHGIGGTPPYQFAMNLPFSFTSSNMFFNVPVGLNWVYIKDSNNCIRVRPFFLFYQIQDPNCGLVTDIDGNTYMTTIIGNQCWMKENLRTTKYQNGTPIEYPGTDNSAWQNNTTGAYAWYNNDIAWKDIYGALYNWHAVNNSNGLCPAGWHVPSDEEWTELLDYVVDQGFPNEYLNPNGAGNALKSCRQVSSPLGGSCATSEHPRWNSYSNHYGFDEFGFSALPGGLRETDGSPYGIGHQGLWWSSTVVESYSTYAWYRDLIGAYGTVNQNNNSKSYGFSVRCVKDFDPNMPTTHSLYLDVSPAGSGQVGGMGSFYEGAVITINATPNEGYQFVNWTGDINLLNNPNSATATLTMPGYDVSLTANFEQTGITYGEGVTDIDGNFYPSVIIGNQEWMAENLRVTRDANGNDITRYCYNDDAANCDLYGGLYTWHTVMNGATSSNTNPSNVQGICPTGWHVPTDAEWTELVDYVVAQGYPNSNVVNGAGNALKSCRQVSSPLGGDCATSEHPRWNSHSTHYGTDEFGFSALPGGYRSTNGAYGNLGSNGFWWSSSELSSASAWARSLGSYRGGVSRFTNPKGLGFSVRCVRD